MTIATRFRTVVWVAAVAVAALGCYLVSLRVAAERAELARVETRLRTVKADIRQLATELDTRSRLVQLERWNSDVLALTAPRAGQYLTGEVQLASLAAPVGDLPGAATTPAAAELMAPPSVARVAYAKPEVAGASRLLHSVSMTLDEDRGAMLRPVALIRSKGDVLRAYPDGKIARP